MTPGRSRIDMKPTEDFEDQDPGLARERTSLAWKRTAISFAALGGALLRTTPLAGLLVLGMSALIWGAGRISASSRPRQSPGTQHHLLITVTVTVVSATALVMVLLGGTGPLLPR